MPERCATILGLWTGLFKVADRDHRMHVITEVLPYNDVISLYASADCFISLHRSEGLGLGMMEAMLLGKPVIATGWSGNLDFMTADELPPCWSRSCRL